MPLGFFPATKTDQRTYPEAKEQIHQSLDRLQTNQPTTRDNLSSSVVRSDSGGRDFTSPGTSPSRRFQTIGFSDALAVKFKTMAKAAKRVFVEWTLWNVRC
jgi:hypothetical protein